MAKWADFVIARVKYNREHTAIAEVETRTDTGETIAADVRRVSRQDVVASILRGTTFVTAYVREGTWQKGEDVGLVTIHGERFIRTDSNAVRADNLGNLPEYV
jgi:hypothetical protein